MQPPLRRTSPCTLTEPSLILCPRSVSSSCSSCSLSCLLFSFLLLSLRTLPIRLVVLCPHLRLFALPAPETHSVRSPIPAGTMPTTPITGTTRFRHKPPLRSQHKQTNAGGLFATWLFRTLIGTERDALFTFYLDGEDGSRTHHAFSYPGYQIRIPAVDEDHSASLLPLKERLHWYQSAAFYCHSFCTQICSEKLLDGGV